MEAEPQNGLGNPSFRTVLLWGRGKASAACG